MQQLLFYCRPLLSRFRRRPWPPLPWLTRQPVQGAQPRRT
jgi:hypothetical protein